MPLTFWENPEAWDFIDNRPGTKILEPNAGTGNMAKLVRQAYPSATLHCCEIDDFNRFILESQGFDVIAADFLSANITDEYDYIIMNPPFDGTQYVDHINKAISLLKIKGRLAAIVPANFLTSTVKKVVELRNLVAKFGNWEHLEENAFKESGTNINCVSISFENYHPEYVRQLENEDSYGYPTLYSGKIGIELSSCREWHDFIVRLRDKLIRKELSKQEAQGKLKEKLNSHVLLEIKRGFCYLWDEKTQAEVFKEEWQELLERVEESEQNT